MSPRVRSAAAASALVLAVTAVFAPAAHADVTSGASFTIPTYTSAVASSPDGSSVYVAAGGAQSNTYQVLRYSAGGALLAQQNISNYPSALLYSPVTNKVYEFDSGAGVIDVFDPTTLAPAEPISLQSPNGGVSLGLSPDGADLYVDSYADSYIEDVDLATGTISDTVAPVSINDGDATLNSIGVVGTTMYVSYSGFFTSTMIAYDLTTGAVLAQFETDPNDYISNLPIYAATASGLYALYGSTLVRYSLQDLSVLNSVDNVDASGAVASPSGKTLYLLESDTIEARSTSDLSVVSSTSTPANAYYMALSADGTRLFVVKGTPYPDGTTTMTTYTVTEPTTSVPDAPTGVTATAGVASATVSFTAPLADGGAALSGYTVTASDVSTAANGGQTASGAASPIRVTALVPGDQYTFTVTATNSAGTGPASTASATVRALQAQVITFSSTPATPMVGTRYTVQASGGGSGLPVTFASASTTCTVSGSVVTFVHVGRCVVTADQEPRRFYARADQVKQVIVIGKGTQAVHFTSTAPVAPQVGDTYAVSAAGNGSPAAVVIAVSGQTTKKACSLVAGTVHFDHAGYCVITASQARSPDYSRAVPQTQSWTVTQP